VAAANCPKRDGAGDPTTAAGDYSRRVKMNRVPYVDESEVVVVEIGWVSVEWLHNF